MGYMLCPKTDVFMKRLFTAAVMLLLCSCSGGGAPRDTETSVPPASVTAPATETTTEESTVTEETAAPAETVQESETVPFEDTPESAYSTLMTYITSLSAYPDTYAGAYSYFGKLYVCLTAEEAPPEFTDLLDGYSCVAYRVVGHSLNYLDKVAEDASALVMEKYTVTEYYADVPSNKAVISVAGADLKEVREYLESLPELPFALNELTVVSSDESGGEISGTVS